MDNFSKAVDLLSSAMSATSLRYNVTANNLANAEVPNFKRTNVNFESELKRVLQAKDDDFEMLATHPLHIRSEGNKDFRQVSPHLSVDYVTTSKANGNNVNAEEEAMNVLKTQLNYQLLSQMQNFNFSQIRTVLK
ncbi:MAG: flagellar basal body rod protein FlgB [Spirochaetaceae bacterium]|nr:flagellar basal body rod protein FlgB [Spirochaetaceae bacterium]